MRKQVLAALFVMLGSGAHAQWVNYPAPGIPRTHDGKPNLAAKTPRASDGKPDLSGVWHVQPTSLAEMKRLFGDDVNTVEVPGMEIDTISKYGLNIFQDFKPEDVPMRPAAAEIFGRRFPNGPEILPSTHCLPLGVPLVTMLSELSKIVQTPGLIVIMLELDNTYRQIYTDGRKLPVDPSPSWLGYSVGRWEGDTLVVDTAGLNDKGWIDALGHPQSEAMHITERYRRRDFGHMDVEITMDDPKMYTKPFTVKVTHVLQADSDVLEYVCTENETDRAHMRQK
jgi:hypothetical protein